MAAPGPKFKPDALKAPPRKPYEAKKRAEKANSYARYDPADLDMPPVSMEERVAKVWSELAPVLARKNIITEADVVLFTTICEIVADIRQYQDLINQHGPLVDGAHGAIVKNPLISPLNTLRGLLRGYLCEIGWTPGSRMKIAPTSSEEVEEKDPLSDILGVN